MKRFACLLLSFLLLPCFAFADTVHLSRTPDERREIGAHCKLLNLYFTDLQSVSYDPVTDTIIGFLPFDEISIAVWREVLENEDYVRSLSDELPSNFAPFADAARYYYNVENVELRYLSSDDFPMCRVKNGTVEFPKLSHDEVLHYCLLVTLMAQNMAETDVPYYDAFSDTFIVSTQSSGVSDYEAFLPFKTILINNVVNDAYPQLLKLLEESQYNIRSFRLVVLAENGDFLFAVEGDTVYD